MVEEENGEGMMPETESGNLVGIAAFCFMEGSGLDSVESQHVTQVVVTCVVPD